MIADNLSFMNLPISALVPKDFSHSLLALSRSQSMAQSSGCAVCESGSNTWTPVTDTIGFLKLLVALPLRMSAMTEKSFGSFTSIKSGNGDDISATPVVRGSFTYTGREWESEVDMFYYRARWYSPTTGRFLQSDPDPGKLSDPRSVNNKFIGMFNNPLFYKDATGKSPLGDFFVALVSFLVGYFLGPIIAVGNAVGSAIAGAVVGAIAGGITNVAIGNGTFDQGARIGAIAGFMGGFAGAGGLDSLFGAKKVVSAGKNVMCYSRQAAKGIAMAGLGAYLFNGGMILAASAFGGPVGAGIAWGTLAGGGTMAVAGLAIYGYGVDTVVHGEMCGESLYNVLTTAKNESSVIEHGKRLNQKRNKFKKLIASSGRI